MSSVPAPKGWRSRISSKRTGMRISSRGSPVLAEMTGATRLCTGPTRQDEIVFADTAREGDVFRARVKLRIAVLETPGHTDDHLAFVLHDGEYSRGTGRRLHRRCPLRRRRRAHRFLSRARAERSRASCTTHCRRLCGLGDQAIIYPAHGAGSVCGSGMADREFSTIGHERRNNPRLQHRRPRRVHRGEARRAPPPATLFPADGAAEPRRGRSPAPRVLRPRRLRRSDSSTRSTPTTVVDVREPLAYASRPSAGCHVPSGRHDTGLCRLVSSGRATRSPSSHPRKTSWLQAMAHLVRIGLD